MLLTWSDGRLELRQVQERSPGPVFVDFVHGSTAHRRVWASKRRQPIAMAMGIRRGTKTVLDATAGLARDSFLLATLGFEVTMVERNPILAALIRDGIRRGSRGPVSTSDALRRMTLVVDDARQVLARLDAQSVPDAIYLDPMYAPRRKMNLPKKDMRLCRDLAGDDDDAAELLRVARHTPTRRVVVKRHRYAPPLAPQPDIRYAGKQVRYDVYLADRSSPGNGASGTHPT